MANLFFFNLAIMFIVGGMFTNEIIAININ